MQDKRLLMISTDRKLFEEGSDVRARHAEYAKGWNEVHIIVFSGRDKTETSIAPNCWVYPTRSRSKFLYSLDAIRLGKFIISRRNITEITTQDASLTAMAGISLKKQFGLPLEIQVHEDIGSPYYTYSLQHKIRKALALSYIPKADKIRVVSERIKKYLTEQLKIAQLKITVRPIIVDIERIKVTVVDPASDLRKKYSSFDKIALMVTRFEKEKNIDLALQAWVKVLASQPRAGLVIVGAGSLQSHMESLAQNLSIKNNVIFESWADKKTLISYYKSADVFLNTSLFEGYGMALVEAQAAGCKVVSTDVGVAREIGAHIVGYTPDEVAQGIISNL